MLAFQAASARFQSRGLHGVRSIQIATAPSVVMPMA